MQSVSSWAMSGSLVPSADEVPADWQQHVCRNCGDLWQCWLHLWTVHAHAILLSNGWWNPINYIPIHFLLSLFLSFPLSSDSFTITTKLMFLCKANKLQMFTECLHSPFILAYRKCTKLRQTIRREVFLIGLVSNSSHWQLIHPTFVCTVLQN